MGLLNGAYLISGIPLAPLENPDGFFKVLLSKDGKKRLLVLSRDSVISLLDKTSGKNRFWVRKLRRDIDHKLVPENLERFFLELLIAALFTPAESSLVKSRKRKST